MTIEHEALILILQNQAKLANMIANSLGKKATQLQDDANRIAVDSQKVISRIRGEDQP